MSDTALFSRRAALLAPLALAPLALAGCSTPPGERADERGIGGTGGIADRGIGGTGIVGTVTAFGSIWVNGRRIALDDATPLTWEGRPISLAQLRLGAVVAVLARPGSGGQLLAEAIDLRIAVAGPVQQRLADGGLIILGQRIETSGAQVAGGAPRPGDWVAVAGLRRVDGTVSASRVDPWPATRGWVLRGLVEAVGTESCVVSGQRFLLGQAQLLPLPGVPVRLAGRLTAAGPSVAELASDPFNPFGTRVTAVVVESYLDAAGRPWATPLGGLPRGTPGGRGVIEALVNSQNGALLPGRAGPAPRLGERGQPAGAPPGLGGGPPPGTGGAPPGGGDRGFTGGGLGGSRPGGPGGFAAPPAFMGGGRR